MKKWSILFLFLFLLFPFFNLKAQEEEIEPISIKQAREKENETEVVIKGIVTVEPDILSAQYFYLQDETAGVKIYCYKKDFPKISLGDEIKVIGEIGESYNEKRVKIQSSSDIQILGKKDKISPKEIEKIDEEIEGQLVKVKGEYQGTKGKSYHFFLKNQDREFDIYQTTESRKTIQKPKMKQNDEIEVIGIVSQYKNDYRILPRYTEDIKILKSYVEPEEQKTEQEEKEEELSLITIKEARNLENDREVLIEGIVTVLPNILSSSYFYLQDETSGIQIYFSKKDFPNLEKGQKIQLKGNLSEAYQEKRIKIYEKEDIKILGKENLPEPIFLKTGEIKEEYEGKFVKTKGTITKTSGNIFYLDDGTGNIKIYLKKETKIQKPKMKKGDLGEVSGILSQYKDTYRILPFLDGDIKVIKAKEEEVVEKEEIIKEKEEETKSEIPKSEEKVGKVLGATKKENYVNWKIIFYTLLFTGLPTFGFLGYLYHDYYKQKRKTNPKNRRKTR